MRTEKNKLLKTTPLSEVKQIAHKIKGGASVVGAHELSDIAQKLEQSCKDNLSNTDELIPQLIKSLDNELEKVENWFSSQ